MSAIVIMELGVRPMEGCTLWHADDDNTWTVVRNDNPDDRIVLTMGMVAAALDSLRHVGLRTYDLGRLWMFSGPARALEFRAVVSEGDPAS